MTEQITSDVSPAAFERELRMLRFKDRDLERAFQDSYDRRRIPQWRLVFWIGLAIQIPISLRFVFVENIGLDDARFWLRLVLGVVPAVAGLRLARSPRALEWLPRYIVFYVLLIGIFLTLIWASIPLGWTFLTTYATAACIMSRLSARQSVVVLLVLSGWYSFVNTVLHDLPQPVLVAALLGLSVLFVFISVANYILENAARRDFVLQHLLGREREKSERLLLNVLPEPIAQRLKESPRTIADNFDEITVLFADIADSTPHIAKLEPETAVDLLNDIFTAFDRLAAKHGLEKIKTIGDAYMVVGGLSPKHSDHAAAVVAMALDMQAKIAGFTWPDGEPVVLRIGIDTGPAVAGVIGASKFIYDLWGDTVNVASRLQSHGTPNLVHLTRSTYALVRDRHRATARRVHVKGKGPMQVYVLQNGVKRPRQRKAAAAR